MCAAFPQLVSVLDDMARQKFRKIVFSKSYSFVDDAIHPQLDHWIGRYVDPILTEAESELSEIPRDLRHRFQDTFALRAREVTVLPALLLLGGGGAISAGFLVGVSTTGRWIFKKQVVDWPILLTFLIAGIALIVFGTALITLSKSSISRTFRSKCLPNLRESVLGVGLRDPSGNRVPSLRQKLQAGVQAVAEEHLKRLKNL